ncbi:MAG: PAS domain-containing protein [Chloroflexi bacterium]|nr:PAS domain-containing protein [Chloroflexota bacterium]
MQGESVTRQLGSSASRRGPRGPETQLIERVLSASPTVCFALKVVGDAFLLIWVSPNVRRMVGYDAEEALAPGWWLDRVHADDRAEALAKQADLLAHDHLVREYRFRHKDGSYHWIRDELRLLRDAGGAPQEVVGSWSDITRRKEAELKLSRLSRLYTWLSAANEVMLRQRDRQVLLAEACRVAVEHGLYRTVWVGFVDPQTLVVRPAVFWDATGEQFLEVAISAREEPEGRGVTGTAVRTEDHAIINDVEHDERMAPWRAELLRRGYRSCAAFPLRTSGRVVGALTVRSAEVDAFGEEEVAILDRLATNLSFALEAIAQDEELRFQKTLLECQSECCLDGLVVVSADRRLIYCNRRYAQVWGLPPEEVRAMPRELWIERRAAVLLNPEEFRERSDAFYAREDEVGQDEVGLKDGRVFERYTAPVKGADGTYYGRVWFWREVTERKWAEEALRESERLLRQAQQIAQLGSWSRDLASDELRWSDEMYRTFGVDPATFAPSYRSFLACVHPDDRVLVQRTIEHGLEQRRPYEWEARVIRPDGTVRRAHNRAEIEVDAQGKPVRLYGILQDLTERKLLEEQFLQAQKMEALGRLAGGIAHDFNNLLTVVNGFGELALQRLDAADPVREYVAVMKKAGESGASLTKQLLAFSRQDVVAPQALDLNAVVAGVENLLRRTIGEDIALVMHLAPDLGPVRADPGQMQQVIMNLAVNARDAMPHGGTLTIETANVDLDESFASRHPGAQPGPHVLLVVSDTGTGMTPEIQAHVFEPFFTTKERGRGTGLGLATVYGVVDRSGGTIGVYSEPGLGTTFKICLPRVAGDAGAEVAAAPAPSVEDGTETVLLVEDDTQVRDLVRRVLVAHGYTVLEVREGAAALAIAEQHDGPIDLLLTDVVLPGMSGRALAEGLAARRPGIPAVYMSGYTDNAIAHHGVLDPGVELLQKPFRPEALLRKVRQVLDTPWLIR